MIIDKENSLSIAQAVTTDAASTDYFDQLAAGDALGGAELYLVVRVDTTFTSGTSAATVVIKLQTDDNSSFSSPTDKFVSGSFAIAGLAAGTNLVRVKLPVGLERYIRVYYDTSVEAFTAGKFDAFLTPVVDVA